MAADAVNMADGHPGLSDDRSCAPASLIDALTFRDAGEIGVQTRACGRPLRGPTLDVWLLSGSGDA